MFADVQSTLIHSHPLSPTLNYSIMLYCIIASLYFELWFWPHLCTETPPIGALLLVF